VADLSDTVTLLTVTYVITGALKCGVIEMSGSGMFEYICK